MTDTLAERLLHGYRAQLGRYDAAADVLAQADALGKAHESLWADALHAHLQEAAALNTAMAEDIAAWRQTGQPPAGALKDILERLAQRVRVLSEEIDRRVGDMQARRSGLAGEIDEFIQQRRMLHAYVRNVR